MQFLPLVILGLPFVELALLLKIGSLTNWKVPLLLVLVMGVVGIVLLRSIGWLAFRKFQDELRVRPVLGDAILDTVCLFSAGLLFLFPGILTDLGGVALLLPITRGWIKRWLMGWIRSVVDSGHLSVHVTVDGVTAEEGEGESHALPGSIITLPSSPGVPTQQPRCRLPPTVP